jgi:hypothetical protein
MRSPIDAVISKTKGMAEGVRVGRHGLVGVFKTLSEQHGEAAALFERVKKHPGKREHLWPRLRVALLSHEKAELLELYPVVRDYGGGELADRHDFEAASLERMIHELEAKDFADPDWMPLFKQLASSVIQHAHEEERDIFPEAQRLISEPIARQLDEKLRTTQKAVMGTVV